MTPIRSIRQSAASLLALGFGLWGSLPASAEGGHPAHYLVFELDTNGGAIPLFHRFVELGHRPESLAIDKVVRHSGVDVVLEDAGGEVVFRDAIGAEPWIRGEFHGAGRPGVGWQIESHRFARQRRPFVVVVPRQPGTRLVLDGAGSAVFNLDALAEDAGRLPLAHMASRQPRVRRIGGAGDPGNRVDLLIMGDGYTSAAEFDLDSAALADDFFGISPYSDYSNFVNVVTLHTPSAQDGADHPPFDPGCALNDPSCCADPDAISDPLAGTYVDTAFDGRYCAFNIHRLAVVDSAAALAAASAVPDWDHILMLINDDTYGGSGGFPPVTSTHPLAVDIARHEYGHSFTGLADEYDSPNPGFPPCSDLVAGAPCEPNVTDETSPGLIKWRPWIGLGTPIPTPEGGAFGDEVGLFEGARYLATGMYRPRDTACLMHFLGTPFGEICAQTYVLTLYQGGWGTPTAGIDPIEPGSEDPTPGPVDASGPVSLSVDLLAPVGGPALDVSWWVDDVQQSGATSDTFIFDPPGPGPFQVEIRVEDATALVHPEMAGSALQSQRTWEVSFTVAIFADGFESGDTASWSSTTTP